MKLKIVTKNKINNNDDKFYKNRFSTTWFLYVINLCKKINNIFERIRLHAQIDYLVFRNYLHLLTKQY